MYILIVVIVFSSDQLLSRSHWLSSTSLVWLAGKIDKIAKITTLDYDQSIKCRSTHNIACSIQYTSRLCASDGCDTRANYMHVQRTYIVIFMYIIRVVAESKNSEKIQFLFYLLKLRKKRYIGASL